MPWKVLQESVNKGVYYATLVNSLKTRFLCEICNITFSKNCYLSLHMKYHGFQCLQCGKVFRRNSELKLHMRKIHQIKESKPKESNFTCEACHRNFDHPFSYRMHLYMFHRDVYVCKVPNCNMELKSRDEYHSHKKFHEFTACPICGKEVKRIKDHFFSHLKKSFRCKLCKKRFNQSCSLRKHFMIHLKLRPHICSVCGICFWQKYNMIVHFRSHSGEKPFECQMCKRKFNRTSHLNKHVKTVHAEPESRLYKCDECKYVTVDRTRLITHKKNGHVLQKVFKCNICSKILKSQQKFDIHAFTHADKKPFPCQQCIKEYVTKAKLENHVKKMHLQNK